MSNFTSSFSKKGKKLCTIRQQGAAGHNAGTEAAVAFTMQMGNQSFLPYCEGEITDKICLSPEIKSQPLICSQSSVFEN